MTNYELLLKDMTVERMAENNVKLVTVNNRRLFYMTSTGQLFTLDQYEDAVRYEYTWLNMEQKDKSDGKVIDFKEATEGNATNESTKPTLDTVD